MVNIRKKALFYYNKALSYFINKLKNNKITYDSTLNKLGIDTFGSKIFKGVHPVDKIPDLSEDEMCIINVDTSDMPGSHWVACAYKNGRLYVYDSFGRQQGNGDLKRMYSIIRRYYDKIEEAEHDAEQVETEYNCGQRSLAWLFVFRALGPEYAVTI
jgi:hypothetical protein